MGNRLKHHLRSICLAVTFVLTLALPAGCGSGDGSVSPGPSALGVPNEYRPMYDTLATVLDQFAANLATQPPANKRVIFGAELLTANCNRGEALLQPENLDTTVLFLNRLQELGVQGVTVAVHYPLYTPDFPRYGEYVAFYKWMAAEVHRRGMALDVESHVVFANTPFSTLDVSFAGVTFDMYKEARRALIARIVEDLQPEYLNIGAEPDTEATLLGMQELLDPQQYTAYLNYILSGLDRGATKVIAGIGSWGNLDYARRFVSETTLDGLSLHVYPVVGDSLATAVEVANLARQTGKILILDECGLYKTDTMPTSGVAMAAEIFRRDAYSFWSPLDEKFLAVMAEFSKVYGVEYVSPFWVNYFFANLVYNQETAGLTYNQISTRVNQLEYQNLLDGKFMPLGEAYREIIRRNN